MLRAFSSPLYIHPFSLCSPLRHGGIVFSEKRPVFSVKSWRGPGPVQVLVWPGGAPDSALAQAEAAYRSARRAARRRFRKSQPLLFISLEDLPR